MEPNNKKPFEEKKSKKRKANKKPLQSLPAMPSLPPLSSSMTEEDFIDISQLMSDKIMEAVNKEIKNRVKNNMQLEHLHNIIKEFSDNFMVIGYTLYGEPFFIANSQTTQERDAIAEYLRIVFFNMHKPPQ